ncbi:putative nuclease HARBI1 [Dermacentor andersoni]|uniref:putative nuclease HARBI1 n=1 Tax=Dermacentor andersoni TaxID=34620 RepID=UPI002417E5B7|nr:putative nuclease HARBI1 [Dermacentor andersoni]
MAAPIVALLESLGQPRQRIFRDAFDDLTEEEFRDHFRLSKRTVRWLCEQLEDAIGGLRTGGITTQDRVLCALRFFATGSFQRSIGSEEFVSMGQASVSESIHAVAEAITVVGRQQGWVSSPLTTAGKASAKAAFADRGRIPGVVACVDGTLIAIKQPEGLSPGETAGFMSRKGFYALNTMIVCDAHMRIVDIDPRFPGSCHDSYVWRHSPLLGRLTRNLRRGEWVLGDSGYPLEPWLLTPVPGHPGIDTPEGRYNQAHASMRNVVERGIGVLKARFRCLQRYRTLLYEPKDAATIVAACAALHNIALKAGEPELQDSDEEAEDNQPPLQQGLPVSQGHHTCRQETPRELLMRAKQMRSQVVNLFSAAPSWRTTHLRVLHRRLRQQHQAHRAAQP